MQNTKKIRDNFTIEKQIQGNVSLVWEYFSKYGKAPQRTEQIDGINVVAPTFFSLATSEKGAIVANVGQAGQNYINWAHSNGYKVWPWIANEATNKEEKDFTSSILNDYKSREKLINSILAAVEMYNLDGINLDFENMYESDKDAYTRLVIELAPRLKELGKVLGQTDADSQVNEIEVTESFLNMQIEKAEEARKKNQKMYKTLGVVVGLVFVIILI